MIKSISTNIAVATDLIYLMNSAKLVEWMDKEIQPFSFLVTAASSFELLSCYNLCELIMINIRLAFWGPIQSVAMNKKWQGKGWQSHRRSFCHYLWSILSFFNRSVTFCGGGPGWWNAYFNWYIGGCGWT